MPLLLVADLLALVVMQQLVAGLDRLLQPAAVCCSLLQWLGPW
jgi:hypothetical protein